MWHAEKGCLAGCCCCCMVWAAQSVPARLLPDRDAYVILGRPSHRRCCSKLPTHHPEDRNSSTVFGPPDGRGRGVATSEAASLVSTVAWVNSFGRVWLVPAGATSEAASLVRQLDPVTSACLGGCCWCAGSAVRRLPQALQVRTAPLRSCGASTVPCRSSQAPFPSAVPVGCLSPNPPAFAAAPCAAGGGSQRRSRQCGPQGAGSAVPLPGHDRGGVLWLVWGPELACQRVRHMAACRAWA